jgi:threonine/homoserine/homoserine lactone efflux protein
VAAAGGEGGGDQRSQPESAAAVSGAAAAVHRLGGDLAIAAQIVLLGLVHTANCAAVYTGVGTAARLLLRARPAAARVVTRCSGAAMVVIGALLLAERVLG